jgi:hypothetical protein
VRKGYAFPVLAKKGGGYASGVQKKILTTRGAASDFIITSYGKAQPFRTEGG